MLITTDLIGKQYEDIKFAAARLKARCQVAVSHMTAGDVDSNEVTNLYRELGNARDKANEWSLISGIGLYASTVEEDTEYDLVAELTAISSACSTCLGWIETNFPESNGWILAYQLSNGDIVPRQFTPTQTTGLRTALQTIIALIG